MTESVTHGSSIVSMSPAGGMRAGLSTTSGAPPRRSVTRYSTDGAEAISSRLNSRSRRSWTISMWRRPRKPQRKPKPRAIETLGLEGEAGVVEVQLLHRVAEERVVLAGDRVDAGEDEALGRLVAGERLARRAGRVRHRVADLGVADALEPGRDVADLAGRQQLHGHELGPEDAQLEDLRLGAGAHQADPLVLVERPGGEPDVRDDALVLVVVGVEDEALERRLRAALRRRDPVRRSPRGSRRRRSPPWPRRGAPPRGGSRGRSPAPRSRRPAGPTAGRSC